KHARVSDSGGQGHANSLLRFLVIGSLCVGTDFAVYMALCGFGVGTIPAKASSYCTGMLISFPGNKYWTFQSLRCRNAEPIIYVVLYTATLFLNVLLNMVLLSLANQTALADWSWLGAFVVSTGITTALNYLGMRYLTFRAGRQLESRRLRGGAVCFFG